MDHKNLLKKISTEFQELLKNNLDRRLAKVYKKMNLIIFELLGGFYREVNINMNKKEKVKKNQIDELALDTIQINFRH
jgi:hypothetical protein